MIMISVEWFLHKLIKRITSQRMARNQRRYGRKKLTTELKNICTGKLETNVPMCQWTILISDKYILTVDGGLGLFNIYILQNCDRASARSRSIDQQICLSFLIGWLLRYKQLISLFVVQFVF